MDAAGCPWSARWGGRAIVHYSAEGKNSRASGARPNVTSCAFGGEDLCTLFITTASEDTPDDLGGAPFPAGGESTRAIQPPAALLIARAFPFASTPPQLDRLKAFEVNAQIIRQDMLR